MSEYTPTTNEVRADFIALHTRSFDAYATGRSLTSEEEYYGEDFDRWLEQVKAEAWHEGHRTPVEQGPDDCQCAAWCACECGCGLFGTGEILTPNPYRQETE